MKEKKTTAGFIPEQKETKPAKKEKNKETRKNKEPGFFKKLGMKMKDVFSELKKVSWPSFSKILKQTGIVLVVVLLFLVVITAFDTGLLELLNLVVPD